MNSFVFSFFRSGIVLFSNADCECTIGQIGEAFHPRGYLCSLTAPVGTYMLGQKYKNSDKLVAPYIVCVSSYITFYFLTPFVHDVNFSWLCDNTPFILVFFIYAEAYI